VQRAGGEMRHSLGFQRVTVAFGRAGR